MPILKSSFWMVYLACIIIALKLWFYVDWPKAALIGVCHIVVTTVISIGLEMLTR